MAGEALRSYGAYEAAPARKRRAAPRSGGHRPMRDVGSHPQGAVVRERYESPEGLHLSMREKLIMFLLLFVIASVFLATVTLSAYLARLQDDINAINAKTEKVNEEISKLYVRIEMERNIGVIEEKATKEMGLDYAGDEQIKYIVQSEYNKNDLIQYIREKVYGQA